MVTDKILLTANYVEGDLTLKDFVEYESRLANDIELQNYLNDYEAMNEHLGTMFSKDIAFFNGQDIFAETEQIAVTTFSYQKWMPRILALLLTSAWMWFLIQLIV